MPGCPIVRIKKHKTSASIRGAMGHHLRAIPTSNADPVRTPDNVVLRGPDDPTAVARLVKSRTAPLVRRKDANRAVELFLGASDDYWADPAASWMDLAESYRTWLDAEFGQDNVLSFGVHLDETKPHFYALITPIAPSGRLSSAHWFDGPAKLSRLQDRLAEHMAPLGLQRARRNVRATHLDVATWHQAQAGNKAAQRRLQQEADLRAAHDEQRAQSAARRIKAIREEALAMVERARREAAEIVQAAKDHMALTLAKARALLDQVARRERAVAAQEQRLRELAASLSPIEEERAARRLAEIKQAKARQEPQEEVKPVPVYERAAIPGRKP